MASKLRNPNATAVRRGNIKSSEKRTSRAERRYNQKKTIEERQTAHELKNPHQSAGFNDDIKDVGSTSAPASTNDGGDARIFVVCVADPDPNWQQHHSGLTTLEIPFGGLSEALESTIGCAESTKLALYILEPDPYAPPFTQDSFLTSINGIRASFHQAPVDLETGMGLEGSAKDLLTAITKFRRFPLGQQDISPIAATNNYPHEKQRSQKRKQKIEVLEAKIQAAEVHAAKQLTEVAELKAKVMKQEAMLKGIISEVRNSLTEEREEGGKFVTEIVDIIDANSDRCLRMFGRMLAALAVDSGVEGELTVGLDGKGF